VLIGPGGEAFTKCLPKRMQEFRATITTPRETLQQVLDPPQTDIESESYTIAGSETDDPAMGLVTAQQVTKGRFFRPGREALVSETYAARHSLKVGGKLNLNGKKFTVVGLVNPPLGGQGADVYLPLAQLQKLSDQKGLVNVVLVRADDSSSVAAAEEAIESQYTSAQVASSKQVADSISGSLVDASNLSKDLGLALSIVAAVSAFVLAALLALSSVGKRVRELGTLKALAKDDAAPAARSARPRNRGRGAARRTRPRQASRPRSDRAPPPGVRLRLPAVQPDPDADRPRERPGLARADGPVAGEAQGTRERVARRGRPRRARPRTYRLSCPAASSSGSRSPARSSRNRASSSPTSRPATSTPRPAPRSSLCSPDSRPAAARRLSWRRTMPSSRRAHRAG
jgi:hypothetical protein